jgi:oligopeptide transport system substrate-binding protein
MQRKKVILSLLAILIVVSLILTSACGTKTSTTAVTPTGEQILRVNLSGEPSQIDPNRASWANERSVIAQVFNGLLGFNQDLSVKAVVAKEIPTVSNKGISADGLTYTFKLRTDVTWSDKKKVTAKDFEYSIKRLFDPDLAAEYASFFFDIVGSEAYYSSGEKTAAEKTTLKDAVGVKAKDDYTLEIKLAQPRPVFISLMSLWPVYPVREDIITQFGDKWTEPPNYIGNGPFILTEWVHQDHMTFKPNPNYWWTKPILTEIKYLMIADVNAELAAYKNNELDFGRVPTGTEKATMADPTLSKEILRYAELTTFAFQFNVTKAPFDNKLVRQAISCAIDRDAFVYNVRAGVGQPALSWIPPGMPGYDPELGKEYTFNSTKAKDLLAQAGYADVTKLPQIKFSYSDTAGNRTIAQFLQGQMKDNLGVDIVLDPMETKSFQQLVNSEGHQWAWFGWGADYPDPDNWLPELFGTDAGNNHTAYSNAAFDELATKAKSELDNPKRLQMWADAQKMVIDDAPIVPIFYRERFVLMKPWVKGLKPTGMDGQLWGDMFYGDVYLTK